jgi:DNA-binding NarL/FixJ family response regulator
VANFVGRATELATLGEMARRALAEGRPVAAFINGDPGSGKRREHRTAARRAGASSPRGQNLEARPSRTQGDPLERLSAREKEVARLVADGSSNPEIAEARFLSRKTVERHVSNLLNKLGARSRTELARRLTPSRGAGSDE